MKIRSITYRENRASRENRFQHQHIELTADLDKGETADKAMVLLQMEVRKLLYPELHGLRERLKLMSPFLAKQLTGLDDSQLGALYGVHTEAFDKFLSGDLSARAFLQHIGLGTID